MTYLLLGSPEDPCCREVCAVLTTHGHMARIVANPLAHPLRFSWYLDNERSASELIWDDAQMLPDDKIAGVLVRSMGWVESIGWKPDDLAYVKAETQAALLAWLWSLTCPVINRYPPHLWFRSQTPLPFWQPLLWRCGLPTVETLVTNVVEEARGFRERMSIGVVYTPLTSDTRYAVASDADWAGIEAMQPYTPVCLTPSNEASYLACVVGEQVVWEGTPSPSGTAWETGLRRFARLAGVSFLEVALATTAEGTRTVAVDVFPHLEHFGDTARRAIVAGLVELLEAVPNAACSCLGSP